MYVTGIVQYVCTGMVHIRECPTDSLLTTHAHYIREGFVGEDKGILGQLGTLLSCTTLCSLS